MTHAFKLPEGTVAHAEGNRIELVNHPLGQTALQDQSTIHFSGEHDPAPYDKHALSDYGDRNGHVSKVRK